MNENESTGWREKLTQAGERHYRERAVRVRTPLTAGQHILHLLLTVFTAGLWLPVWIIRAIAGNSTAIASRAQDRAAAEVAAREAAIAEAAKAPGKS